MIIDDWDNEKTAEENVPSEPVLPNKDKGDDIDDEVEIVEATNCQPIDLKSFFKFYGNNVMQQKLNEFTVHQFMTQSVAS